MRAVRFALGLSLIATSLSCGNKSEKKPTTPESPVAESEGADVDAVTGAVVAAPAQAPAPSPAGAPAFVPAESAPEAPGVALQKVFHDYWQVVLRTSPETATRVGAKGLNHLWEDLSDAAIDRRHHEMDQIRDRLAKIPRRPSRIYEVHAGR